MPEEKQNINSKSKFVEQELETLKFWQENKIFEKTLVKPASKGEFIFYEGPPTANGKPGIHHLEARAFKDAIPRYKTMQGFTVRRKGGWDTHGLPVELAVEKELGLKSKKEIETYGIEAFNKKCRESVWKYVKEWTEFTGRIGYWVDLKRPYVTYKPYYIESVWNIVSKINERGLLYKDYKVVPWCPRCGTGLSSHELAQGYEDVKDLAVTVKFKVKDGQKIGNFIVDDNTYILAWTTTPWTLPGNVGLAVGKDIEYVEIFPVGSVEINSPELRGTVNVVDSCFKYILSKEIFAKEDQKVSPDLSSKRYFFRGEIYEISKIIKGSDLVGLEYGPIFSDLRDHMQSSEIRKDEFSNNKNGWKVYPAKFVTTTEGTGIVHIAPMYGNDDFDLATQFNLPKLHTVDDAGNFSSGVSPEILWGRAVKEKDGNGKPTLALDIIEELKKRKLFFAQENVKHSYPHCWRCHTPLIYFARDSWYIKMSSLRDELLAENKKIHWEPDYIKDGRFGEWLKDIKDWAISRERYWGTPLPIWECSGCGKREVAGSFADLFVKSKDRKLTRFVLVRHGESEKNVLGIFDSSVDKYPLTDLGVKRATEAGEKIKQSGGADVIYTSPVLRTKQTAEIIGKSVGKTPVIAEKLWEVRSGEWDGKPDSETQKNEDRILYNRLSHDEYYQTPRGKTGESWKQVEDRMAEFAREVLQKHAGQTVVLVSHEGPLMVLMKYLKELSLEEVTNLWDESRTFHSTLLGGYAEPTDVFIDNKTGKEIDPHRPFIDDFTLKCDCGKDMNRVKEVMDVWFDSGAMPFAQEHYPFKNKERIDTVAYPADFISEAIDQTRGWFYTLHAIGVLLGKGNAYKNVISLGHILDAQGKKMSKSVGNVVDPNVMMEKYGADALRLWMYSVNQPGEPKNFDEKTVDEIVKKYFNLLSNVLAFYTQYKDDVEHVSLDSRKSPHVLDKWIITLEDKLVEEVTQSLDSYKLLEPVRAVRDFIGDLSQWHLRRSRDRFKGEDVEDKRYALAVLRHVLVVLSKVMAPFAPFYAEHLYRTLRQEGRPESVHLCDWPTAEELGSKNYELGILEQMQEVRRIVSFALEARAKANIKVRQPLGSLRIKNQELGIKVSAGMTELIKDEVNVKKVLFDKTIVGEVELDTEVTPELKEEGSVRELVRAIQELRKTAGLNPGDLVTLSVDADEMGKSFVKKYESALKRTTQLKHINFTEVLNGSKVTLDDFSITIAVLI